MMKTSEGFDMTDEELIVESLAVFDALVSIEQLVDETEDALKQLTGDDYKWDQGEPAMGFLPVLTKRMKRLVLRMKSIRDQVSLVYAHLGLSVADIERPPN